MTKKEWSNIRQGTRVTMTLNDLQGIPRQYKGTVIRMNSNHSQALVRWDGQDTERWYGRLGIDLLFGEEKK